MRLRPSLKNSSTCRRRCLAHVSLRLSLLVEISLLAWFSASAQVPSKSLSHYLREEWGSERGFPGGPINVIAQTPDGYLWMGTQKGLVRFDGREFHLFSQLNSNGNLIGPVLGLITDSEGNLWVRLQGPGLLRYRDGKFEDFTYNFEIPEVAVTQMCRSADGQAVFATIMNGTLAFNQAKLTAIAPPPHLPNFVVMSITPGPHGQYFLGTRDRGLFRIREGRVSAVEDVPRDWQVNALLSDGAEPLWIGTDKGLFSWKGGKIAHVGLNSALRDRQILSMIRDSEGSVWVGTDRGLYRLDPADNFLPNKENFSDGGPVSTIFEDRENNIWAATPRGLERFRNTVFTTFSASDGPPGATNGPVYVDTEGRTWFAPAKGGLYWLKDNKTGHITAAGLDDDIVYSIAGGSDDLWVARQHGGLTHLRNSHGKWDALTYTTKQGLPQDSIFTVRVTRDGAVWAGTVNAGLTKFSGGRFTTFTVEDGLASNTIQGILEATDGTMWFATPRGLNEFSNGRWLSFSTKNGLPSDDVNCLFEDSAGVLWVGTASGLAALRSRRIAILPHTPEPLSEPIYGLREDRDGFLWISTANHVLRVNKTRLFEPEFNENEIRQFDVTDGLRNADGVKRDETVSVGAAGQIWLSLSRGLATANVNRLRIATPPTILHFENVSADGKPLALQHQLTASHPQKVTIDFAGLSLSVPDRVRFKYKLDGFDHDWNGPVSSHQAIYTNLNPGSYLFRVSASNSDGIWNSRELSISFTVEPVFWRTWWFALVCLTVLLSLSWTYHRLHLRQLQRQLSIGFEARVSERLRIARELHDTLLQSFQGLLLRFQAVSNEVPDGKTKQKLDGAIDLAQQAITEGRDAVQGLRSTTVVTNDLAESLRCLGQGLAGDESNGSPRFDVAVEGGAQDLNPILRDEVYRIGGEALRNAFHHSQAKHIEVEIHYGVSQLRVRIRDDGKGIASDVVQDKERPGHWGLHGMRERAKIIGGNLEVWSSVQSGTEVELTIPARSAYAASPLRHSWFSRKSARSSSGSEASRSYE